MSDKINDGGAAFPQGESYTVFSPLNGTEKCTKAALHPGMSLRDYFAAQALIGYAANARVMDKAIDDWDDGRGPRDTCIADFLAGLAYEVADSMLEERSKRK